MERGTERAAGVSRGNVQHVQVMNGERVVSQPWLLEPDPQRHLPVPELPSFSKQKELEVRH